jgi:nucleotide-binding universal stress UspA family protein
MYSRIVVPVDCSDLAWTAVVPAKRLAQKWDADLEVLSVVHYGREAKQATADIEQHLAVLGWRDETIVTVVESGKWQVADVVADAVADHVNSQPGSFVLMTSHGRGRSAALFGSVAGELLQLVEDPIMVFGPSVDADHMSFDGRMLVCVDTTEFSEAALDVVAPWALELEMDPWVVSVTEEAPMVIGGERIVETVYPHRMADRISAALGREVDFDALHGRDPAKAIASFAKYQGGLIVAATHGRTGRDRLSEGSVAMNIVRHAPCPVLLIPRAQVMAA